VNAEREAVLDGDASPRDDRASPSKRACPWKHSPEHWFVLLRTQFG
jgi:hypothetical protein